MPFPFHLLCREGAVFFKPFLVLLPVFIIQEYNASGRLWAMLFSVRLFVRMAKDRRKTHYACTQIKSF